MEVQLHSFVTLALDGERTASRPSHLIPRGMSECRNALNVLLAAVISRLNYTSNRFLSVNNSILTSYAYIYIYICTYTYTCTVYLMSYGPASCSYENCTVKMSSQRNWHFTSFNNGYITVNTSQKSLP